MSKENLRDQLGMALGGPPCPTGHYAQKISTDSEICAARGNIDENANAHTWAMARGVGKAPPRTEHSSLALSGRRSHCLLPSILATLKTPMEHSFLASLSSGRRLKGLAARAIPDCSQRTGPGAIVQTSSVHRDQMVRTTCARCARLGSRATETGGSHRKDPCAAAHAAGTANAATPCVDAAMRRHVILIVDAIFLCPSCIDETKSTKSKILAHTATPPRFL